MSSLNKPSAMNEAVVVRNAVINDSTVLSRLLGELGFPSAPDTVSHRLRSMQAFGESVLVAEREGKVIGLLTLHIMPVLHRPAPVGRVSALVVAQQERGKGVGRALVSAGQDLLQQRGCMMIEVTSNQRLQESNQFYRQVGFEEASLRFKKDLGHRNAF